MKVSIIIATLNRQDILLEMLKRLIKESADFYEALVIDQTETLSGELKAFINQNQNIKYIYQKEKSMCKARNRGIKTASGDILFFFDDDSFVSKGIIKAHLKNYKDKSVGAVTGREVLEDQPDYKTHGKSQAITKYGNIIVNLSSVDRGETDGVWGANMSFRSDVFDKIGLFDENLMVRRDETDVALRLRLAGYKIIFEPLAKIIHKTISTGGTRNDKRIKWYFKFFQDEIYFFLKYFPRKYLWLFYWRKMRAILSCMFYYGFGKPSAILAPFRAFNSGKKLYMNQKGNLAPIRIAIDGREAFQKNKAGKGYYAFNIIRSLAETDHKNLYTIYLKNKNQEYCHSGLDPESIQSKKSILDSRFCGNDKWLPANFKIKYISGFGPIWFLKVLMDLKRESIDYMLSLTSFIFPYLNPKRCIPFIYDLAVFQSDFKAQNKAKMFEKTMLKRSVEKSPAIISISKSTRNDLLKKYTNLDSKKISIAYPAIDDRFKTKNNTLIAKIRNKYKLGKKYILSLGTLEPRKNYIGLISAYGKLPQDLKNDYDLVIVGKQGWYFDEIYIRVKELKLTKNVKFIGYLDDSEIPSIYAGAELFAYPAFWEGFGMPVLEALASKIPVLTSNTSSLPEAGGKYAYYTDPKDINEIKEKLEFILKNPQDRKSRVEKSQEHVESFSWNKSAQVILDAIEKLIQSK